MSNTCNTILVIKEVVRKSCFLLNKAYSIITSEDSLNKENAKIKHVLQENRNQESIIGKILKRITKNHILSQSQQQTTDPDIEIEEIKMIFFFLSKWY